MIPLDLEGKKKFIIQHMKNLHKFEHIQIFKILNKYKVKYSENSNGIFINLNYLGENIITQILDFVNFCIKNKDTLQLELSKREDLKKILDANNKNTVNSNKPFDNSQDNTINLESGISYQVDITQDNNETYYKENTFIIPSL